MAWTFDNPLVRTQTDQEGNVRLVRHLQFPFAIESADETPRMLAARYLKQLQIPLRIPASAIGYLYKTLSSPAGPASAGRGLKLRWKAEIDIRSEAVVVLIQQTQSQAGSPGLDVEGAGLRIMISGASTSGSLRVTSVSSTLELDRIVLPDEHDQNVQSAMMGQLDDVLASFGFPPVGVHVALPVKPSQPFVHRFAATGLLRPPQNGDREARVTRGRFYPAVSIRLTIPPVTAKTNPAMTPRPSSGPYELTYWPQGTWSQDGTLKPHGASAVATAIIPLRAIRLFASSGEPATGSGQVFLVDPITAKGDFKRGRPNSSPNHLDAQRTTVLLPNLITPAPGASWSLAGVNVTVLDQGGPGSIGVRPPSNPASPTFEYSARTNDFAAVNAYYHLENLLALLVRFGLPFGTFPMNYTLPVQAIHRAAIHPGPCSDGKCINAQALWVEGQSDGSHTMQFRFALADLQRNPGSYETEVEPLGIACDLRIVWHEFCHGLIAAATDYLEFPFAHSAGDALAAIQCDPDSAVAKPPFAKEARFVTFPWGTATSRRHDRDAKAGWSWTSVLDHPDDYHHDTRDMFGYVREQVLSTTLFRLYRAMGGDRIDPATKLPDGAARRVAADDATYLIVRAIFAAGPAMTTPVPDAATFATLLMHADTDTKALPTPAGSAPGSPGRPGGVAHKAIEWAFAEQGLPNLPTSAGLPAADVFIGAVTWDGYGFKADWHAPATAIWNRTAPDGDMCTTDQPAVAGVDNYLYVAVGTTATTPVAVAVHKAAAASSSIWPDPIAWKALPTTATSITSATVAPAPAPAAAFGPFIWRPAALGDYAMLANVEAPSDLSNINLAGGLPCATAATSTERLVRLDNNLALRVFTVT